MSTEIDELLEDEYAAQQEGASHIQTVEISGENEKKPDIEVSTLLIDISETLRLLSEQMMRLNEVTKTLPETVAVLRTTTETVQCISNELPDMVREQCLEEYKKIFANAVKNYNSMQKATAKWQKSIDKNRGVVFKMSRASAILTSILLLLNLLFR
ncbi:hypothetical protein [Propionispira raffinosivorans]|uniref:hypothetical protein n=1 Tax=Propionispira raffinosivorans TaxID=86959 RepID=UPI00036FCCF4|nr:hypothetical protein [Propionispira raffinosivorans]